MKEEILLKRQSNSTEGRYYSHQRQTARLFCFTQKLFSVHLRKRFRKKISSNRRYETIFLEELQAQQRYKTIFDTHKKKHLSYIGLCFFCADPLWGQLLTSSFGVTIITAFKRYKKPQPRMDSLDQHFILHFLSACSVYNASWSCPVPFPSSMYSLQSGESKSPTQWLASWSQCAIDMVNSFRWALHCAAPIQHLLYGMEEKKCIVIEKHWQSHSGTGGASTGTLRV